MLPFAGVQWGSAAATTVRAFDRRPLFSIATVNGATLALVFDRALDEDSVPDKSAFDVELAGTA